MSVTPPLPTAAAEKQALEQQAQVPGVLTGFLPLQALSTAAVKKAREGSEAETETEQEEEEGSMRASKLEKWSV